ncbi:Uncharacterised protein [Acinetobacter baumannii]|nr:Uncharacterised protein [Acinetobacter baumannii]
MCAIPQASQSSGRTAASLPAESARTHRPRPGDESPARAAAHLREARPEERAAEDRCSDRGYAGLPRTTRRVLRPKRPGAARAGFQPHRNIPAASTLLPHGSAGARHHAGESERARPAPDVRHRQTREPSKATIGSSACDSGCPTRRTSAGLVSRPPPRLPVPELPRCRKAPPPAPTHGWSGVGTGLSDSTRNRPDGPDRPSG